MVEIEKTRLNAWNVGAVIVAIAINSFGLGGVYFSMKSDIDDLNKSLTIVNGKVDAETQVRKDHMITTDGNFKELREQLPQLADLKFRSDAQAEAGARNEANIGAANARIDRVVDSFGGKLDGLLDSVSKLSTRVEVISSRLGDKPQPSVYRSRATQTN